MAKEYIAKESTSQAILTKATETDTAVDGIVGKVGETNDSSGSATSGGIFAKLNKVITDTTSLLTRLTTARAASLDRIGSNGDSGNDTLFGVLSQGTNIEPDVKEYLNSTVGTDGFQSLDKLIDNKIANYSPIRSIQIGSVSFTDSDDRTKKVAINEVNVNKTIVLLYSTGQYVFDDEDSSNVSTWARNPGYTFELNPTSLSITTDITTDNRYFSGSAEIKWQVIEFK